MNALIAKEEADAIVRCEDCDSEELTQEDVIMGPFARHTVSCDDCGWCVEYDGVTQAPY